MRKFFLTAVLGIGLGLNLFAQEQFLGIPYEDLQAAAATESPDNAERIKRFLAHEAELKSMRARGLRAFLASGISDSMRDVLDARIDAVNMLDSLGSVYREARLSGDEATSSSVYFEYLKALRTLKMRDKFMYMFDGLPKMGPEMYRLPGEEEVVAVEPEVRQEPVVVVEPEPAPEPIPVELPEASKPWGDSWNFWLGAATTYNLLMVSDSVSSVIGPDESYDSYGAAALGYSAQMGLARRLGGAFSLFIEAGLTYNVFSYRQDYTDFSNGDYYNYTKEYNLMNMQGSAGLKIRLRRLDIRLAYVYQEALEAYSYETYLDQAGIQISNQEEILTENPDYLLTRGALMFDLGISLIRKGKAHRHGDLQLFARGMYDLDYLNSNNGFTDYTLAQLHIGLRFQY